MQTPRCTDRTSATTAALLSLIFGVATNIIQSQRVEGNTARSNEVERVTDAGGQPEAVVSGKAEKSSHHKGITRIHASLPSSHVLEPAVVLREITPLCLKLDILLVY